MRSLAFAILVALSTSGCATLLHPERTLVRKDQRGDLDTPMVVADVILSTPFFLAGLASFGYLFQLEPLLFPLWLDRHYGTLWVPKEPE